MSRTTTVALVSALLCGLASAGSAQTNGYLLACSSASQLGRGCAMLGGTADPSAMLANPAGLAALGGGGRTLTISGAAFMPSMTYQNAVNPEVAGKDNVYPMPALFFADRARGNLTLGLGMQTMGGMGADYTLTHPLLGANQRYHSKFGLMKAQLAAAYRLSPRLTLGAAAGALYGQIEFATPYAVSPQVMAGLAGLAQDPDYAPMMANFTEATAYANMSGLSGFGIAAGASLEYRASERVRLALAWTAPVSLTMGGGTATMDMNAQFGQLYQGMVAAKGGDQAAVDAQLAGFGINMANGMATTFGAEVEFGIPQTWTLGLGVRPTNRWNLALDLGWIGWEDAFRSMPVRLNNGTSSNINIMINADPTDGAFATAWPLKWKNSWTVRGGAEFAASPVLTLRAGGIYGSNPVSSEGLFTIFPAIVQSAATLGAGYQIGPVTLDATYAKTFMREQVAAASHIVANEYANSRSNLGETTVSFGVRYRF